MAQRTLVGVRETPKGPLAKRALAMEDRSKDCGEEFFTKMHCRLTTSVLVFALFIELDDGTPLKV